MHHDGSGRIGIHNMCATGWSTSDCLTVFTVVRVFAVELYIDRSVANMHSRLGCCTTQRLRAPLMLIALVV